MQLKNTYAQNVMEKHHMKEKHKKLVIKLTEKLYKATRDFLIENKCNEDKEFDDKIFLNIIVSANVSRICSTLLTISQDDEILTKKANLFIGNLMTFLENSELGAISEVLR